LVRTGGFSLRRDDKFESERGQELPQALQAAAIGIRLQRGHRLGEDTDEARDLLLGQLEGLAPAFQGFCELLGGEDEGIHISPIRYIFHIYLIRIIYAIYPIGFVSPSSHQFEAYLVSKVLLANLISNLFIDVVVLAELGSHARLWTVS